jgi:hypothetical protein
LRFRVGSKQATLDKVTTGSEAPAILAPDGRSLCEPFREIVVAKLDAGLSAQRIHQDLAAECREGADWDWKFGLRAGATLWK